MPESLSYFTKETFDTGHEDLRVFIHANTIDLLETAKLQSAFLGNPISDVIGEPTKYDVKDGIILDKETNQPVSCLSGARKIVIPKHLKEFTLFQNVKLNYLRELSIPFVNVVTRSGGDDKVSFFGSIFGIKEETKDDYNRINRIYDIPKHLKKVVFIGDTLCSQDLWGLRTDKAVLRVSYLRDLWLYQDLSSIDTLVIDNSILSPNIKELCAKVRYVDIHRMENLPEGLLSNSIDLEKLILPFPGTGTKENTGTFACLFGTKQNDEMKKVGNYYLPVNLSEVIISEGCEQVPAGAFRDCSMIEKLTLPTTIKGVKENALYGCDGLTDIYVKRALPPSAYESTFTGVNQFGCTLHVPHESKKYYSVATGWKYFYFIEEEAPLAIHVTKNIENAGEIVGLKQYQPGQKAELEAIAHSGYKFAAWTEEGLTISTESKLSLTVYESRELIAVFVPVSNENSINVNPGKGKAVFTWEEEAGANRYTLNVYTDETKMTFVHSSTFDANGTPLKKSGGVNFTAEVTGLSEMETYYYNITAYTEENIVLSQYIGTFSVLASDMTTVLEKEITCSPVDGGICIENATGKPVRIYNIKGEVVYSRKTGKERDVIVLPSGLYIVKVGEQTWKCFVH